jgi:hypothetical protein
MIFAVLLWLTCKEPSVTLIDAGNFERGPAICSCTGSPQGRASVILEYSRDDLLDGFYTHGGDDLIDFVQITDSGTDRLVKLDRDGTEAPTT